MKQIKAHIAVSLDGHTATLDKELDWLPDKVKTIVGKYYLDADCLLMGANTYNYIFEHWGGWPHKSKRSFVVSHLWKKHINWNLRGSRRAVCT